MILSTLTSWKPLAEGGHPVITQAVERLTELLAASPASGRIELQGSMMYASVMELETKPMQEQLAEKHDSYIDIHYLIEGEETIGWIPDQEGLVPLKAYDSEEDYALYAPSDDEILLNLTPGMFAVFFPHDIHRPGMGATRRAVKKVVIKIHTDLLNL